MCFCLSGEFGVRPALAVVEGGSPRLSVPRVVFLVQTLSDVHGHTHSSLHDMSGAWDSAGLQAPGQAEKHFVIPPPPTLRAQPVKLEPSGVETATVSVLN